MANIAENIRALRAQRGMSQAELAERIGKKRSAVGNYESGAREPDLDTLRALAEAPWPGSSAGMRRFPGRPWTSTPPGAGCWTWPETAASATWTRPWPYSTR